jgi:hypothetical protein
MDQYGFDFTATPVVEPDKIVTAVLPHPIHGRLTERIIGWVRPNFTLHGRRYKLTWWGDGIAYYTPM